MEKNKGDRLVAFFFGHNSDYTSNNYKHGILASSKKFVGRFRDREITKSMI